MCRILSMSASEGRGCSLSLMKHWIIGSLLCAWFVASADAAETKPAWQQQWEPIVQGAKKEGQVTVYVHSTYAPALTSGAFEKTFPGIKLVVVSGVENDLERRFTAERRAEKYLADVFMVGVLRSNDFKQAKYLDPIKPILLLPEVADESKWWQGKHYYSDPEKQYLFRYVASAQLGQISYNTQWVQPKEFTSFWDFLNPRWKGKMLARDIRLPGLAVARSVCFTTARNWVRNSYVSSSRKPTSRSSAIGAKGWIGWRPGNFPFAFGVKVSRRHTAKDFRLMCLVG